ncbi:MAG: ATP-binding protein [Dehalococcoidia bacterium]
MEKVTQILVVDDDVDLASNLKDILVDEGYTVSVAHSGKAAITLCREQSFPLVISDLKLPDISGVNLVNQLAEMMPGMESIIITGYASLDTALNAVGHKHIIAYKTKPVDIGDFLSFIRQVFERKQAEEALEESEEKYRSLVNNVPAIVWESDQRYNLTFVSPNVQTILGYTPEEMRLKSISAIVEEIHPDDIKHVSKAYKALIEKGARFDCEHRSRKKDGDWIWLRSRAIATRDKKKAIWANGLTSDISKRKRAEEKILLRNRELICLNEIAAIVSQSNDLNRTLNNALDKVIKILDMDFGAVIVIDSQDVQSVKVSIGFSPEFSEKIANLQIAGGPGGIIAKSGESIFVEDISMDPRVVSKDVAKDEGVKSFARVPLKAEDKVFGLLCVMSRKSKKVSSSDMRLLETIGSQIGMAIENARLSEQASRVKTLEEIDRLRSELFANVSHELRTPLTTIKGYSTLLIEYERRLTNEEKKQYLEIIDKSVDRQVALIEQLLDMTRLETGTFKLKRNFTNISGLLSDAVADAQVRAPNHKIVLALPKGLPEVKIDRERILQVINNILNNAVNYSDEGTKVTVSAKQEEKGLLISIIDEGIGIPAKDLERVFDRLFRVNQRKKPQVGGIGLGLAICKGLVEAHKGRIWMESKEGKGSTCYFTLPLETEGMTQVRNNERPLRM